MEWQSETAVQASEAAAAPPPPAVGGRRLHGRVSQALLLQLLALRAAHTSASQPWAPQLNSEAHRPLLSLPLTGLPGTLTVSAPSVVMQ